MSKNINKEFIYKLLALFGALALFELLPIIITTFMPNLSYGSTTLGKIQEELSSRYWIGEVSWISFILFFATLAYLLFNTFKNPALQYASIFFCIAIVFLSLWPVMILVNIIDYCVYTNPPFISNYANEFPASKNIEANADIIIKEFKEYFDKFVPECIRKKNKGFKIETTTSDDSCWRAIYLKRSGEIDKKVSAYFPETDRLLEDPQIHNAIFSILDPGVEIPPHRGYFKGYLRYHLGIVIPEKDKAYIVCGGQKHEWKVKEGVLFDDMYMHHVKNPSNQLRVVLYLDVKRKESNPILSGLNDLTTYLIEINPLVKTFLQNQHKQIKSEE